MEILSYMAGAFVGGLILNIMPCVFPMLSIKLMAVVQKSGAETWRVRMSGVLYTLGIIGCFWVIAGLILLMKAAGTAVGWGFQLQTPWFVALLIMTFMLIGFHFLGLIEWHWPTRLLPQAWHRQDGLWGEFFAGALVALVASPCSAPFMATAIGFALTQTPMVTILIFTALAVGLGAPFLLLALVPQSLRWLPKPGAWMVVMKEICAFPIFLTMAWLIWIYAQQTSLQSLFGMLIALVVIGFWLWLHRQKTDRLLLKNLSQVLVIALLAAVLVATIPAGSSSANSPATKSTLLTEQETKSSVNEPVWEKFSAERITALTQAGKAVFVDFTAAWCVSCKMNEAVVFGSQTVRDFLANHPQVILMKADLTNDDPVLTQELERFGRSGVPLYLLYGKDYEEAPLILPQLLTADLFLTHLKKVL